MMARSFPTPGNFDDIFSVGEALRGFRLRQGLTLAEVARRSGNEFKVSSLGAYERGDRSITFERLQLLASVYGVDVQSLLGMRTPTIDLVALESRGVGIVIDLSRFRVMPDACAAEVMVFGQAIKRMRKSRAPRSSWSAAATPASSLPSWGATRPKWMTPFVPTRRVRKRSRPAIPPLVS